MRVSVLTSWCLSRLLVLVLLVGFESVRGVGGDIAYYARVLNLIAHQGWRGTLPEYPVPAVALLAGEDVVSRAAGSMAVFPVVLMMSLLVVDGCFTRRLTLLPEPGRRAALRMWLLSGPAIGGLLVARFDLVVGVAVALAVLAASRRPRVAAVLLAVAAALKLWPVIVLPSLVAARRHRVHGLVVFTGTGLLLAGTSVLLAGWGRLVSPLVYQRDRGLQIESPAALPTLVGWLVDPHRWHVGYSTFKAWEIQGPGVAVSTAATTVLTLGLVVLLVTLWLRAWRGAEPVSGPALVWLCLASVTGWWVSSKVFSPQYLLWVLPVAAVGLALTQRTAMRRWCWGLLVVAGLTHLVYPWLYRGLVLHQTYSWLSVTVLGLRNVLVLVLFASAVLEAWRATRPARGQETTSTDRAAPGSTQNDPAPA